MNPGSPSPFNPLDNPAPANDPNNLGEVNPQTPTVPGPEPMMPTINPVPENPAANFGATAMNAPANPYETTQPTQPNAFQPNTNMGIPASTQPENIPPTFGGYSPETVQNQGFNPVAQQPPSQLPQTVDPNAMFNPSSPYPPRQDLMGMPPEMPHASANTSSASGNKVKLILIACGVFMLALIIIVALIASSGKSNNKNSTETDDDTPKTSNTESKAIVATTISDLSKGCQGSPISNAASYEGSSPHKIALFDESFINKGRYSSSLATITDRTWEVEYQKHTEAQLIGCLQIKSSSDTGRKCTLEDSDKKQISIGQYDVTYELKIYEAKTNKELATKTINGPAGDCPFIASYSKSDPKLYGKPDKGSVNEAIKEYVTK